MSEAWSGVIQADKGELQHIAWCRQIGAWLTEAYPGHMWFVGWGGDSIAVANFAISPDYGFRIHPDKSASVSELKGKAICFAGELLERAHMNRGKWDGNFATSLEGADPRRPIL